MDSRRSNEMVKSCICHSCGREVRMKEGDKPCNILSGWLMLSCFKGEETIDRYSFCSLSCLKAWTDECLPDIPDVFLESLDEERNE